ncbi:unnamed protein product [Ostreobium quekettii]|uniref:Carbohydrate kinase FGGY N-terminal domain-containing protein n=1 Tax=Ostreobium quekettii TaxID=121088 RepID=A0A8S1ISQ3_9CHLO|nr:unnamed protein product [Ostreobium quekettii]|eukprot:evm.model.scf_173.5 EVM.evm.TU.scf_173.5   scf_173:36128-39473(-)
MAQAAGDGVAKARVDPLRPRVKSVASLLQAGTGGRTQRSALSAYRSGAEDKYYLGFDFGTSGARAKLIDDAGNVVIDKKCGYDSKHDRLDAQWERALDSLLEQMPESVLGRVSALAFDGTSATTMLIDRGTGEVLEQPKLYNEGQGLPAQERAKEMCPVGHAARASTSSLCKLLQWDFEGAWQRAESEGHVPGILHQADWLAAQFHGDWSCTDYTNSLKLGFDPGAEQYPQWLASQG